MNEKYYVIIAGEYSDWEIQGIARTEEEAVNICCQHNQRALDEDGYVSDRWYYEETGGLVKPKELRPTCIRYITYFYCNKYNRTDIDFGAEREENTFKMDKYGSSVCYVYLNEWNKEKAFKIACDMRAEYLAREAEVLF